MKTTHTHTPGPWTGHIIPGPEFVITGGNGQTVFLIGDNRRLLPMQTDARLIAAAPDLLAALKSLVDQSEKAVAECLRHHPEGWDWGTLPVEAARKAIAKAEGRQP